MDKKHFFIIAGANKCGTTTIFSYLSRHPEICPSIIKETMFFLGARYNSDVKPVEEYSRLFGQCSNRKYLMESTPGYLDGGARIASHIKNSLTDVRIIFILRNPADRLISFYNSQKAKLKLSKDITIDKYIVECRSMPNKVRRLQANNHYWGIDGGYYAKYLHEWYSVFPPGNIRVYFFDDLKSNVHHLIEEICIWLEIDPKAIVRDNYEIHNKTTLYENKFVHKTAIMTNAYFEPFFRKFPELKSGMKKLYYVVNGRPVDETINDTIMLQIEELYRDSNCELRTLLHTHGYQTLPAWLVE